MSHPRHHQPQMPPRPRLLYRQTLQQPGKLIGIRLKQPAISLSDPPRDIRRPLPDLDILAKKRTHQRPNGSLTPTDLLSDHPRQGQTPPSPSELAPQRLHAAKYISVFSPPNPSGHTKPTGRHLTFAPPKERPKNEKVPRRDLPISVCQQGSTNPSRFFRRLCALF